MRVSPCSGVRYHFYFPVVNCFSISFALLLLLLLDGLCLMDLQELVKYYRENLALSSTLELFFHIYHLFLDITVSDVTGVFVYICIHLYILS